MKNSGSAQQPVLDAAVRAFLDRLAESGAAPIHALGFAEARQALAAMQAGPVAAPSVAIEDITLSVGPTGSVAVRMFRPPGDNGPQPAVIYLHGGGWVMGGKHTHDRLVRELAAGARATFVFVDYALAPEACYPVQNEQAYAVLTHVRDNAVVLGLDASRIAVAGDCVGGNMAAALTLLAKRRRGPEIAFQLLFYPVLDDVDHGPSHGGSGEIPWLTQQAKAAYIDAVMPDAACRAEVTAFPLKASVVQLNDLPTALVVVAEHDIVRDEGEAYVRKLVQAGVTATCTRCNNTIHDFVVLDALADAPITRYAVAQAIAALRAALHGA